MFEVIKILLGLIVGLIFCALAVAVPLAILYGIEAGAIYVAVRVLQCMGVM